MVRQNIPIHLKPLSHRKESSGAQKRRQKEKEELEIKKLANTATKFFQSKSSSTHETIIEPGPSGSKISKITDFETMANEDFDIEMCLDEHHEIVQDENEKEDEAESNNEESFLENTELKGLTVDSVNTHDQNSVIQDNEVLQDPSDPYTWKSPLSQNFRSLLLDLGPQQVILNHYEVSSSGSCFDFSLFKGEKANKEKYERTWILYSRKANSIYCFPCIIFGHKGKTPSPWGLCGSSSTGFCDFVKGHASRGIERHEKSDTHVQNTRDWKLYMKNVRQGATIDSLNEKQISLQTNHWVDVLKGILSAILYLSRNNLAFRGPSDDIQDKNCGNFLGLVKLLSQYYPPLTEHLQKLFYRKVSYLSHESQNEFIKLCGTIVRKKILNQIRERKYYAIMFDSTPDSSKKEQVSQIIRTVKCNETGCSVEESFVDFISTNKKTGLGLSQEIIRKLKTDELEVMDCRGQCYDRAANMSGEYKGVQKWITDRNPRAFYLPCDSHGLNLVGAHAAEKVVPAKLALGKIQSFYCFFSSSTLRWQFLKEHTEITLKCHSSTRWASRFEAVEAITCQLEKIVETLTKMTTDENFNAQTVADADSLLTVLLNFKFILSLVIWHDILCRINVCNNILQQKSCDVEKASKILLGLAEGLKKFKCNGFEMCYQRAESISDQVGVEHGSGFVDVRSTRGKRPQQLHQRQDNVVLSQKDKFKIEFFDALVDCLIHEMDVIFKKLHDLSESFKFLWGQPLLNLSAEDQVKYVQDLCLKYEGDFCGPKFFTELQFFSSTLKPFLQADEEFVSLGPMDLLNIVYKNGLEASFPNVETALRIFLTIPVAVATNERSFSKLKIIKSYLRSQMGQERLSNLAILSIESDVTDEINFDEVIRRGTLV